MSKKPTLHFVQKSFAKLQKTLSIVFRSQQVIHLLISQLNSLVGDGHYSSIIGSNFSVSYLLIFTSINTSDFLILGEHSSPSRSFGLSSSS